MKLDKLLAGTLALVLIAGMSGIQVFADSVDETNNLAAPLDINPPQVCVGSEKDLLIQDGVPWSPDANHDPRGAFVTELIAQDKDWCAIGSDAIGATDLSQFDVIITTSDQSPTYYGNLFPGNVLHPDIDAWVQAGGVLSASLADQNYLSPNGVTMPQGMTIVWNPINTESIIDATHPLITGASPCPSGNCGEIVDVGSNNDIDDWNLSHHNHFGNIPAGAIVIIDDSAGNPVAVEYNHGTGVILAHGLTDAWRYNGQGGGQNLELLANDIAYQNSIDTTPIVGGEFLSIDSTALLLAAAQSPSAWLSSLALAALGIGAYVFSRNPNNMRNIKVILRDYLDRI